MLGGMGGSELIIIFLIILIFFGADKIPELARGLGQGMSEFRKASNNLKSEIEKGKRDIQNSAPKKEDFSPDQKKDTIEEKQEQSTQN